MIRFFADIDGTQDVGGKAASLVALVEQGFTVPNGFVVTSTDDSDENIREAFAELGETFVAVRSSANREDGESDSFAGQFESFLFVDEDSLIQKIQECFDSVNSQRIAYYCESKDIEKSSIHVCVIVQKMVNANSAGVCFTEHPLMKDQNALIIESTWGLGEALVSGIVTPDSFIVEKSSKELMQKTTNEKDRKIVFDAKGSGTMEQQTTEEQKSSSSLTPDQVQEITEKALQIEKNYGMPMDIEWAYEGDTLYILQARPITA